MGMLLFLCVRLLLHSHACAGRQAVSERALEWECVCGLRVDGHSAAAAAEAERAHVVVVVITHLQLKMSALLPTLTRSHSLSRSGTWLGPFMKCKRFACGFSCFLFGCCRCLCCCFSCCCCFLDNFSPLSSLVISLPVVCPLRPFRFAVESVSFQAIPTRSAYGLSLSEFFFSFCIFRCFFFLLSRLYIFLCLVFCDPVLVPLLLLLLLISNSCIRTRRFHILCALLFRCCCCFCCRCPRTSFKVMFMGRAKLQLVAATNIS